MQVLLGMDCQLGNYRARSEYWIGKRDRKTPRLIKVKVDRFSARFGA